MKAPLLLALGFCSIVPEVSAAWLTQVITLRPGWNAVHFQVDPANKAVGSVFQGIPVKSVWRWNESFSSVRFIQDASALIPRAPGWFSWLPPVNGQGVVNNLNTIDGGRTYLVELDGAVNVPVSVKGEPVARPASWVPDSFNLAGFKVDPANKPTISQFFINSAAHINQPVYRMQADGQWARVTSPSTERLNPGEAYWIFTKGQSVFDGFVKAQTEQRSTLEFGRNVVEQVLSLKNDHNAAQTVTLTLSASENIPAGADETLAGSVALSLWKQNTAGGEYGWYPVTGAISIPLAAGSETPVRLAVRRPDLAATTAANAAYRSLLTVKSNSGSNIIIPVHALKSASGIGGLAPQGIGPRDGPAPANPRAGLWVGSVSVSKVNQPANTTDATTPKPTATDASFRLILHVDDAGAVRLLSQVMVMWKQGTKDANGELVDPGRYALLTDESLIPQFSGSTLRDGKQVGRRISSVAFGFPQPLALTGPFGGTVTGTVTMDYNDPLNPFKHRYHPDHDNKDARFETVLPEGKESFTIGRALQLEFSAADPEGVVRAGWGDTAFGGVFKETITGVHRNPIKVEGTFRLSRITNVGVLNQ